MDCLPAQNVGQSTITFDKDDENIGHWGSNGTSWKKVSTFPARQ